jgi:hypothetical protein
MITPRIEMSVCVWFVERVATVNEFGDRHLYDAPAFFDPLVDGLAILG